MSISDWSATELCTDQDCASRETRCQQYGAGEGSLKKWRDAGKKEIETRLRFALKDQQKETATDVLDLIGSYEPLRMAAMFISLHLLFNDLMANTGDLYTAKASYYLGQFEEELGRAVPQLSLDLDESGVIADTEEQNINFGVKFYR